MAESSRKQHVVFFALMRPDAFGNTRFCPFPVAYALVVPQDFGPDAWGLEGRILKPDFGV